MQCVVAKIRQFGLNFGPAFVWQFMRLRPVPTLAATLPIQHVYLRLVHFLGDVMEQETSQSRPICGNKRLSCTVQHTTTRFTYRTYGLYSACVSSYCHMRAITLSYAGPNTIYCPRTTELLPAYDIRHNKRA